MKNLLLFFIVAVLFASCKEEEAEAKYGTKNYKFTYESDSPASKAMAVLLDSTLSKESADLLVRFSNDHINLNSQTEDMVIILFTLLREYGVELKKLSPANEKSSSIPTDNASASLEINAEIVKEWMKKNPKTAKVIVQDHLKENPQDAKVIVQNLLKENVFD